MDDCGSYHYYRAHISDCEGIQMTLQETLTRLRDESAKEKQLPYSDELKPIIGAYWCGGFDHAQDLLLPLIEKWKASFEEIESYSSCNNCLYCAACGYGVNELRKIAREALSELKKLEEGLK